MNRRELFQKVAGMAAAAGVAAPRVTLAESNAAPALAVFELPGEYDEDTIMAIDRMWAGAIKGTPYQGTRCLLLMDGLKLSLLGADGRILNLPIQDKGEQ